MKSATQDSPVDSETSCAAITASRALIEQTKGMLMFVYGIDADAAFDVLRKQSQQHNIKLRLIAEQVLKDWASCPRRAGSLADSPWTACYLPRINASPTSPPGRRMVNPNLTNKHQTVGMRISEWHVVRTANPLKPLVVPT
jgi:hypothetical protein